MSYLLDSIKDEPLKVIDFKFRVDDDIILFYHWETIKAEVLAEMEGLSHE